MEPTHFDWSQLWLQDVRSLDAADEPERPGVPIALVDKDDDILLELISRGVLERSDEMVNTKHFYAKIQHTR